VVWLQKETKKMIASVVKASFPDEAITKVFTYHNAIDPECGPSGTVFVARLTEDRNGAGKMLMPWMGRVVSKIEARPVYCYEEWWGDEIDLEGRETLQALDNLAYEAEYYGEETSFDAAKENWDLQTARDAEAERKYGEYLDDYDEKYDDYWEDYWGLDEGPVAHLPSEDTYDYCYHEDWDYDDVGGFTKEEPVLKVIKGNPTPPKTVWNGYEWTDDDETKAYLNKDVA